MIANCFTNSFCFDRRGIPLLVSYACYFTGQRLGDVLVRAGVFGVAGFFPSVQAQACGPAPVRVPAVVRAVDLGAFCEA